MKIIDMHCDTISRIFQEKKRDSQCGLANNRFQVDLVKMKSAGYLLQNFAIFIDLSEVIDPYNAFLGQLAVFREQMRLNARQIAPVVSYSQIMEQEKAGKISALLTLEEGEALCGQIERLKEFYDLGIRMMTFTWNYPNSLGYPAEPAPFSDLERNHFGGTRKPFLSHATYSRPYQGLTPKGKEFLEEMERFGIIPDVSHLSDEGIRDVCKTAKKPFCASHSNARALCGRKRNLPDELIRDIAAKGGVIGVNYYGPFLSDIPDEKNRYFSRVEDIARHIRHIAGVGGISCIGLGSDFDGMDDNLELENCSRMELLERELRKLGFRRGEIEQIFYKNVLDFYRETL